MNRPPKTFIGVYLLYLYLVPIGAQVPGLDCAGWDKVATGATRVGHLTVPGILPTVAEGKHR
ncbi:MAG: hypothetical protein E4H37_04365 [Gemmatimonadales bacterium]|nr:MAG: hypothetical protein E4H37_04365 [Gemmatimonadales bacterium]